MNGNIYVRAPNYFIARWLLVFLLIFLIPFVDVSASEYGNYNSIPNSDNGASKLSEFYSRMGSYLSDEYNLFLIKKDYGKIWDGNEYIRYICYVTKKSVEFFGDNNKYSLSTGTSDNIFFDLEYCVNNNTYTVLNPVSNSYSNFQFYDDSFSLSFNDYQILYANLPLGFVDSTSNQVFSDFLPVQNYDISDLNSYPINSINVTSPVSESNIKTNGRFVSVAIKGKIGIDCTDDIAVTKEDLGKLIRNNFRYSFKSDKESFDNLSYFGPVVEDVNGSVPSNDDIVDILQILGSDYPIVKGESIKLKPLNDNWTIGVSGNVKDWTNKKYYNFIINTALYVGENDGDYTYKLNFKVPVGFGMNITYKTITVDYKLSRGSYVDDDFNGIDDNTNEIIPAEEIEIINPSTSTPFLPSDDGLDDGLQVVSILKDIYKDFCNGVNGAANILKSFFSVVNSTVQSVVNYSEEMVISFSNIFGFMPSPVPQLITMSLAIMIFVSVLGFIKK